MVRSLCVWRLRVWQARGAWRGGSGGHFGCNGTDWAVEYGKVGWGLDGGEWR